MPQRISDVLGVTHEALEAEGAFNAFVDIDSQLYLDPHLLESTSIPEFSASYKKFRKYFEEIIRLLDTSSKKGDQFWRATLRRLQFKEVPHIGLGYSTKGTGGSAIGKGLAADLMETARELVEAGIKDPIIFELVGLLQEGIGADRVSDMTIRI